MFNHTKISHVSGAAPVQILFNVQHQMSVSVMVDSTMASVNKNGRKIVKAGTPLAGDLAARDAAFKAAGADDAVGVLLHDVDITEGNANGSLLIWGFVNLNRLESDTQALVTAGVKSALSGKVTFLKD
jgi:hypothetical protein